MVAGGLGKTGGFDLDFARSSDGLDVKSGWGWGGKDCWVEASVILLVIPAAT